MILLDTNVISEAMRLDPDPRVIHWLDAQAIESLYLSTINLAELRFGIAILPEGRKKCFLESQLQNTILPVFTDRLLTFDEAATQTYAQLRALARKQGKAIADTDGYIAAIALANGIRTVATRDTSPFLAAGLSVINPWH